MRVCQICIAEKGLKGSDLEKGGEKDMDDDEEFFKHIEKEHHIPVRRKGETKKQCMVRFKKDNPESGNPATCRCPSCVLERKLGSLSG